MDVWLLILQSVPLLAILYIYIRQKYSYWSKLGVKGPNPSLLKFGNVFQIYTHSNPAQNEIKLINQYSKVYGTYTGLQPSLTVADKDLIKQVMVKDFHLFANRREIGGYHELVNINQFFAEGNEWKRLRSISTPSFTTGKLRRMHSLMSGCVDKLTDHLKNLVSNANGLMNTKEVVIGFSLDVIAATSFATETNANNSNEIKQNPLLHHAIHFLEISQLQALSFMTMPRWFNKLVGVRHFFNDKSLNYLIQLVEEVMRQRKVGLVGKRNDLLQLLMDAYVYDNELAENEFEKLTADMDKEELENQEGNLLKQTKEKLTDAEIIAQSVLFFTAGYETSSSTITRCIFELSQHPQIQEQLYQALESSLSGLDNSSDEYLNTVMNRIPYLDAVVKETLRKYPVLIKLDRRVMDDGYKLAGIPLKKGQLVEVSIYGVHYNPEYYPSPQLFNPDRFMPQNKHLLVPYTYLPFGIGPRNCVGMRFAYQEIKLCLAQIVRQFKFSTTAESPSTIESEKLSISPLIKPFVTKVYIR